MQVSIESTSNLERRMTVGIPAERVEKEVTARLQKAAQTVRINGFRPGKVPFKVVRQRFGEGVRAEVLNEVMRESLFEALGTEELKPAGMPAVEPTKVTAGEDVEFVATFEVYPEIELQEFSSVSVTKLDAEIADADIDKMIDVLRNQQASWEAVERAAANDDQVNIDFEGFKDGEAFEGGQAEGHDLVLGSNGMIPGFEEGLVGASAGEERTLSLVFPEDYQSEELAGAAVEFKVKVNTVSEQKLPELDDEFFKKYGVEEGGEDKFREELVGNMGRELKQALKGKLKNQVMDSLLALHSFDVPSALVDQEIDTLRRQAVQQFGAGADFDFNMLPKEMFQDQAEKRVKLGLLMSEVVEKNELKADGERVRETIEEMASTYNDPEEVVNYYYAEEERLAPVESLVLEDQIVDMVLETASVETKSVPYEEAVSQEAPAVEEDEAEEE